MARDYRERKVESYSLAHDKSDEERPKTPDRTIEPWGVGEGIESMRERILVPVLVTVITELVKETVEGD